MIAVAIGHEISAPLQDYLETILALSSKRGTARVTDIANRLSNAKASVTEALTTLETQGLVEKQRYGPVRLTDEGLRQARRIQDLHDALRRLLTDILGVDDETAEADACAMEHVLSDETMKCLVGFVDRWPGSH